MGDLQVGKLYRHEAQLSLWRSYVPSEYLAYQEQVGQTEPYDPILILELRQEHACAARWAHVLVGGVAGWLKVHYLHLEPIDPEGL